MKTVRELGDDDSNETAHWLKARAKYAAALKALQIATDDCGFIIGDLLSGNKHELVLVRNDRMEVIQIRGVAGVKLNWGSDGALVYAQIIVLDQECRHFPPPWYVTGYESKADYDRVTVKGRPKRKR